VILEELGSSSAALFQSFERTPLAAASLAQVHKATLKDGRAVAVKVQYPELRANMASDLAVFRTMGAQARESRLRFKLS
jgi:predicted unusual protein kinase regulating ubiquinone biosynthesis (AarF/ABC1/UbiB family)